MNRFFAQEINDDIAVFDKDESTHLAMVLRLSEGDKIEVICEGRLYLGEICDNDKRQAKAKIIEEKQVESEPSVSVTLFQGLPKGSKMDFVVQKCTELGINEIVPIIVERCVAKGKDSKVDRLNRIAYESCKQCKRVVVPVVRDCIDLKDADFSCYDLTIVAYEEEEAVSLKQVLCGCSNPTSVAIIVGPEGGFERSEIEYLKSLGVKCASLGKRILRSETAGMATLSAVLYHYGEMEV